MLPREHFAIGCLLLTPLLFANFSWTWVTIAIASNVLIDFDHYMCAVYRTKKLGLINAFKYYEDYVKMENKGLVNPGGRGDFHIFHTVEIHILVLLMYFIHPLFFAVFIGMLIHTITDIYSLMRRKCMYRREHWLIRWILENPRPDFSSLERNIK